MAVMAAFVAGTIATATPVFAPPPEDDGEGGWKAAVADLQMQVDDLETQVGPVLAHYIQTDEITLNAEDAVLDSIFVVVKCDLGDEHTGGGFRITNPNLTVTQSFAAFTGDPPQDSWVITVEGDLLEGDFIEAFVVCADYVPLQ